jgi:two-component system chemotaxis sensor kinase CheA
MDSDKSILAAFLEKNRENPDTSDQDQTALEAGDDDRTTSTITLAIINALLVQVDDTTYAIPRAHVVELVRVYGGDDHSIVTMMAGSPVLRLRGELLPLVDVSTVLGVSGEEPIDPYVVVVSVDGRRIGLLVDGVRDTCDIVVKPLGAEPGRSPSSSYAGATMLGDGSVARILDVPGLVARSGSGELNDGTTGVPEFTASESAEQRSFLMLRSPDDGAMAVPLDRVVRLHEFAAEDIELHGLHYGVRYGDHILPLAVVAELLPERRSQDRVRVSPTGPRVPVVVCQSAEGDVGLVVAQILDIAQSEVKPTHHATRDGVAEAVLVGGRIAEVLDVDRLVELARQQMRAL